MISGSITPRRALQRLQIAERPGWLPIAAYEDAAWVSVLMAGTHNLTSLSGVPRVQAPAPGSVGRRPALVRDLAERPLLDSNQRPAA